MPNLKTPLLWLLGVLLVLALATAGFERTRAAVARADAAKARQDLADYKLSVSETTRIAQAAEDRKAADRLKQQKEAADAARLREKALVADAAGARGELERLRNAVRVAAGRDPVSGTAPAAGHQHASAERELFLECAAAYAGMAETAGGHASDVQTLSESWPKR